MTVHNAKKLKLPSFKISKANFFLVTCYVSGDYVKYNSNSGYINDKNLRRTPQAFSHFTFERSEHQLIVVDVQGVGDLYTDPQVQLRVCLCPATLLAG